MRSKEETEEEFVARGLKEKKGQSAIGQTKFVARGLKEKKGQSAIGQTKFVARGLKEKKGQSAMEYLMTYGWAVLVLLILTAFLVNLNLTPSLPGGDICNLGPNLGCSAQVYSQNGQGYLLLSITNSFGYTVNITNVNVTDTSSSLSGVIIKDESPTNGKLTPGNTATYKIKFVDNPYEQDQIAKFKAQLKYYSCSFQTNPSCDPTKVSKHDISGDVDLKVGETQVEENKTD